MIGTDSLPPPIPAHPYREDRTLRECLRRLLPADVLEAATPDFESLGGLVAAQLHPSQAADRDAEPRLVQWDPWGARTDRIEITPHWTRVAAVAAGYGLVGLPYERRYGRHARVVQAGLIYLLHPPSDLYTCPLAMSDGAVRTLLDAGAGDRFAEPIARLTSREPAQAWISGQWMTEIAGGSDVGAATTRAEPAADGAWRLHGRKWFASAAHADMALALARPVGNGPGGSGLALFMVRTRDAAGALNGIRIERLKDKLGTRKLPTAELTLDGALAHAVCGTAGGTRAIEPMLAITRLWNSLTAASSMRRALALARAYAGVRHAFGHRIQELPLHADTLAGIGAETDAATLLALELAALTGRAEAGEADAEVRALLRLATPIVKLTTARQAVAAVTEAIECFGGAGYVEDTGLPALLRDVHVFPIWEGTTNVLALDALLRADADAGVAALQGRVRRAVDTVREPRLAALGRACRRSLDGAQRWMQHATVPTVRQAGARRWALTLGRTFALALLVEHAQWLHDDVRDDAGVHAAQRFAMSPFDLVHHGA